MPQPARKPTLYALLARRGRLDIANGDSINELRTLHTLSSAFDVYYNNEPFDRARTSLGDEAVGPSRTYDYYYIRNNPEVFATISGKRISLAYPYHEQVFRESYGFVVLTENWKDHLRGNGVGSDDKIRCVYEGQRPIIDRPILNVGQCSDTALASAKVDEAARFRLRCATSGAPVFGYYGNLNKDLYPYRAFAALERLAEERGDASPIIALAGKFRAASEISYRNSLHVGQVPYEQMPALHANTLANLTNESPLNHCLGNQKVIDSLAQGVPVMCQRLDTFVHQLGDDYPCFYETEDQAYALAKQLIEDRGFLDHMRAVSRKRAAFFKPEAVIDRFIAQDDLRHFM